MKEWLTQRRGLSPKIIDTLYTNNFEGKHLISHNVEETFQEFHIPFKERNYLLKELEVLKQECERCKQGIFLRLLLFILGLLYFCVFIYLIVVVVDYYSI